MEQREPGLGRVVVRGRPGVRCDDGRQVDRIPGLGLHPLRVHEPVAAHPDVVGGVRQVGDEVAPRIVGHDDLDVTGRQLAGLGNHPDSGFGTAGAGHHAGDVVAVHGNGGALRATRLDGDQRDQEDHRCRGHQVPRREHPA